MPAISKGKMWIHLHCNKLGPLRFVTFSLELDHKNVITKAHYCDILMAWCRTKPRSTDNFVPKAINLKQIKLIQRVIAQTVTPTWINTVPHSYGESNAGTIKADEWRTVSTLYLPLALVLTWLDGAPDDEEEEAAHQLGMLDHSMSLFQAVILVCRYTMTGEPLPEIVGLALREDVLSYPELHPERALELGWRNAADRESVIGGGGDGGAAVQVAGDTVAGVEAAVSQMELALVPRFGAAADGTKGAGTVIVSHVHVDLLLGNSTETAGSKGGGGAVVRGGRLVVVVARRVVLLPTHAALPVLLATVAPSSSAVPPPSSALAHALTHARLTLPPMSPNAVAQRSRSLCNLRVRLGLPYPYRHIHLVVTPDPPPLCLQLFNAALNALPFLLALPSVIVIALPLHTPSLLTLSLLRLPISTLPLSPTASHTPLPMPPRLLAFYLPSAAWSLAMVCMLDAIRHRRIESILAHMRRATSALPTRPSPHPTFLLLAAALSLVPARAISAQHASQDRDRHCAALPHPRAHPPRHLRPPNPTLSASPLPPPRRCPSHSSPRVPPQPNTRPKSVFSSLRLPNPTPDAASGVGFAPTSDFNW
ncbi:hypothetical protein B0H16DRAFT_1815197 [Mycena metata]|uniref:Uncharacterized protein n=1 Tax=Mycena metata TaxID=1033252 RepID=A0AAD7J9S8_9AGAR|nr:hypothetical protein B0H16DRAFT_1815197 [Mycena metata]